MTTSSISVSECKAQAERLTQYLAAAGVTLKHTNALEAVAKMHGFRDYQTLRGHGQVPAIDTATPAPRSPYAEAYDWIQAHPGTGSARSFAKLLLSLWNQEVAVSVRECVDNLDDERSELALRVLIHFVNFGEDAELIDIGYKLCESHPRIWEMGQAATSAKRALERTHRADDERADAEETANRPTPAVKLTVEVPAEKQGAFTRMVVEFLSGRGTHHELVRTQANDHEQGLRSLRELVKVAQRDSGQCHRIALFLAGLYNGSRFPFDLTNLRAIDDQLFEHCMAVLRLDQHPKQEVHRYFPDGSTLWENSIIGVWNLDQEAALDASRRLARFVDQSKSPAHQRLARDIEGWQREVNPRDF